MRVGAAIAPFTTSSRPTLIVPPPHLPNAFAASIGCSPTALTLSRPALGRLPARSSSPASPHNPNSLPVSFAGTTPSLQAAVGDFALIAAGARSDPDFANSRDAGGLTALQCVAGSRMPAPLLPTARRLIGAGAGVRATASSWSHDIDASYLAASAGNRDIFELLLDRGGDATRALCPVAWNGGQ